MRDREAEHSALSERFRVVCLDVFGQYGGPILARRLRVPQSTLARLEAGRPIPGVLVLKLIEATGVNPQWLLYGEGERYRQPAFRFAGDRLAGSRAT
jgi:helix-turn-helix protein